MVKLDVTRDYYSDLELPPTCTNDDIKKQYRKLALKYHPDRNRGKEHEYNEHFQAIQAAFEVLADVELRSRYDIGRRKGNLHTGSVPRPKPPRSNPYQATSDFPPPVSRTHPRPPPGTTNTQPTSSSGADRYTNFPSPPPRREAPGAKQDAKARANMFSAWQHMTSAQKAQAQPSPGFGSASPPQGTRWRPTESPPNDTTRPRRTSDGVPQPSAFGEIHRQHPGINRSASHRVRRDARVESFGLSRDETLPTGAAHVNSQRPDRTNYVRMASGFPPPPPPRPQAPTARRPDPVSQFRSRSGDEVPFYEGSPRVSTPYAANPGERTMPREKSYFTEEAIKRSASVRDDANWISPNVQYARGDGQPGRPTSTDPLNKDAPLDSRRYPKAQAGASSRPFIVYSSSEASEEGSSSPLEEPVHPENVASSCRPKAQPSASWVNRNSRSPLTTSRSYEEQKARTTAGDLFEDLQPRDSPRSNVSLKPDVFARTSNPELRRDANISPPDQPSPLTANDQSTGTLPRQGSHSNLFPPRGYASIPQQVNGANHASTLPYVHSPLANDDATPPSPGGGKFAADQWAKDMKEENWASRWAQPPSAGTSTQRSGSNIRRPRASTSQTARSPTKQTQFPSVSDHVDDQEDHHPHKSATPPSPGSYSNKDSDAMDIDLEFSPKDNRQPPANDGDTSSPQVTRKSFVATAPPVWHDNESTQKRPSWQYNGTIGSRRASAHDGYLPQSNAPPPPMPNGRRVSSITMADLKHVHPFGPETSGGIQNLNDLSTNLPFPSQSSSRYSERSSSLLMDLPKPPKAPLEPLKLTLASWNYHLSAMATYMSAWNQFYSQIVSRFQDRAVHLLEMEKGSTGGMVTGWLGAVGETAKLGGWDSYVSNLKEDARLRTHWTVACEKHMEAVEQHGRLRNRILRGEMTN